MKWLKQRLQEKSTITALIGLVSISLSYTKLPIDLVNSLVGILSALLLTSATTEG